jgi:hypothetical protein
VDPLAEYALDVQFYAMVAIRPPLSEGQIAESLRATGRYLGVPEAELDRYISRKMQELRAMRAG